MQEKQYSTKDWSNYELHPKAKDETTVDFIFLMDLLNFCFWSDGTSSEAYAVEYRGKKWTGYWSLVAAIQRALDEGTSWRACSKVRGCSIWYVELLRREIRRLYPEETPHLNAILIDFFLYDTMKEMEAKGHDCISHHRTRSIWY